MGNNWRPDDWVNPHANPDAYYLYEAGADGMLKACRENWRMLLPEDCAIISKDALKVYLGGLEVPKVD